jgi:effector-binding domain-containing protein
MSFVRVAAIVLAIVGSAALGAEPQQAPPAAPSGGADVKVVTTEPIHGLVLPMKGSYMLHQQAFEQLVGQLQTLGAAPTGAPFGRYFNEMSVGEANLLWEVGFPVAADVTAKAPFEVKDIPGTQTAILVHTGPYEESATEWPNLIQWIVSHGYRPSGAPMNVFLGDPISPGTGGPRTELRMPVEKVQ